jgi:hypothetical protein
MFEAAKAELAQLRSAVEQAVQMGNTSGSMSRARGDREAALLKLGELFYKAVEAGEIQAPASLKRALGEVKAKDAEILRQQADIAAILKEAEALVAKKAPPAKKKTK